jgi:two-component system invasion response regulator UvrY
VTVRIVLADDNRDVVDAVRDVLAATPGLALVATAGSGDVAVRVVRAQAPDVVLVDVEMPGGGPDLARRLLEISPPPRVMALSARDDEDTVLAMLAAGATAYVAKGALDEDLAACVRRCAGGALFVVAGCTDRVRERLGDLWAAPR